MRIAHVIPSLSRSTGGPAIMVSQLCQALNGRGHHTAIYTTDASSPAQALNQERRSDSMIFPEEAVDLNVNISPLWHPYRIAFSPALMRQLSLDAPEFDVIHIHSLNLFPQWAAWRTAEHFRKPFIVTPHGALDDWIRKRNRMRKRLNDWLWQQRMLEDASVLHATSVQERDAWKGLFSASHVKVVPNGVQTSLFASQPDPESFRKDILQGYGGLLIGNHGRLSSKKGLDILIAALPRIRSVVPVQLALIGADEEGVGESLRKVSRDLGIEEYVHFVPTLSGQALANAVAAVDLWVLPSHTENFGIAVVEAMAAGRPIVTSPHVDIASDAAAHGALQIANNEPQALADAVLPLLCDHQLRARLGSDARAYAQRFDWSQVIGAFESMYEQARTGASRAESL